MCHDICMCGIEEWKLSALNASRTYYQVSVSKTLQMPVFIPFSHPDNYISCFS